MTNRIQAVITVYVEVKRVSVMLVMRWIKVVNCACHYVIQDVESELPKKFFSFIAKMWCMLFVWKIRGNCTAPNTCSCNRGYELNANGACVPKCTNGCEYGECVAPEKCDCRPGFVLQNLICSPVCPKWAIKKKNYWKKKLIYAFLLETLEAVWMVYVQHQINVHVVKDGLLTKAARDAKQDVINLVWMVIAHFFK